VWIKKLKKRPRPNKGLYSNRQTGHFKIHARIFREKESKIRSAEINFVRQPENIQGKTGKGSDIFEMN
jgi:hypothetical protein